MLCILPLIPLQLFTISISSLDLCRRRITSLMAESDLFRVLYPVYVSMQVN